MTIKSILLCSALTAASIPGLNAKDITLAEAQETAGIYFPDMDLQAEVPDIVSMHRTLAKNFSIDRSPFYIFNDNDGNGFVIVAGDDKLPEILGYSDCGSVSFKDMPDALACLLDMNIGLTAHENNSRQTFDGPGTEVVAPLLGTIAWGQDYPFNLYCPEIPGGKGTHYYVGCVATAATQIMKYYESPSVGSGQKSYRWNGTQLSADFGATNYIWSDMPPVMPDNPTPAQENAASTIAYHFGVAVEMTYAEGGSGAYTMLVSPALKKYFGYSEAVRMHSRDYYTTDEWMDMIKNELDNRRPVYYSATSDDRQGGHAFVCDGYDSSGYVHINWGWYGRSNGYFRINHLNPSELGEGGGTGGYNVSQEIITDFVPGTMSDAAPTAMLYGATRMSATSFGSDMTFMTYVENLDTDEYNGKISAVLTKDGVIVATLKEENLSVPGFAGGKSGSTMVTMRMIPTSVENVEDGKYRLNFAFRNDRMDQPSILRHPIGLPSYANCEVNAGTIIFNGNHDPKPDVKLTAPVTAFGELYVNGCATFNVTLRNESPDFRLSQIVMRLQSVTNPDIFSESIHPVDIYDLSEENISLDVDLPANLVEGDYEVSLYHKDYPDNIFDDSATGRTVVTILPERKSPALRLISPIQLQNYSGTDELFTGDRMLVGLRLKNYGAPGTAEVIIRLQDSESPDKEYVFVSGKKEVAKGEKLTMALHNILSVSPGEYAIRLYTLDDQGNETPVYGYDEPIRLSVNQSNQAELEVVSFDLPIKLTSGSRIPVNLKVKALKAFSGRIYVRLRQFTNSNGELAYMGSHSIAEGSEKSIPFNYTPALEDGRYMVIIETMTNSGTIPAANYPAYYREITVGDGAGVESVENDDNTSISIENGLLKAITDCPVITLSVINMNGQTIKSTGNRQLSVNDLIPGAYIARIVTEKDICSLIFIKK